MFARCGILSETPEGCRSAKIMTTTHTTSPPFPGMAICGRAVLFVGKVDVFWHIFANPSMVRRACLRKCILRSIIGYLSDAQIRFVESFFVFLRIVVDNIEYICYIQYCQDKEVQDASFGIVGFLVGCIFALSVVLRGALEELVAQN